MLEGVESITLYGHRPPNNPEWMTVFIYAGRVRKFRLFAPDEAGAYAKLVRMTNLWHALKQSAPKHTA